MTKEKINEWCGRWAKVTLSQEGYRDVLPRGIFSKVHYTFREHETNLMYQVTFSDYTVTQFPPEVIESIER